MPPTPPKPRIPGSQVAPGQRPLYRDAPTASTHSKLPISQATAGKTYRVRCKDWVTVHGEGLTWEAANKLKDQRASEGFRTARVEDEAIPPPEWYSPEPATSDDQLPELGAAGRPAGPDVDDREGQIRHSVKDGVVLEPSVDTRWSEEDRQFVATTWAFPSLCLLAPTRDAAVDGLVKLIKDEPGPHDPEIYSLRQDVISAKRQSALAAARKRPPLTPNASELADDPGLHVLRQGAFAAARSAAAAANARVSDNGAAARAEHLARMTGARPVVVTIPVAPPPPVAPDPPPRPPAAAAKFVAPAPPRRPAPPPNPNRVVPRDRTVQGSVFRRSEPPPRDRTAASEVLKRAHAPAAEPPRPLISPLKAAMMADDPLDIPDGAVGDDDLSDLVSDLGGGATDRDVEQAKAQAAADRRAQG